MTAARDIAHSEGWQAVTIRRVAEHISYAPPVVYEYFANKDALVLAIADEGYTQLLEALKSAASKTPSGDHMAPLRSIALAYYRFAARHPEVYALIFDSHGAYCHYRRGDGSPTIPDYCVSQLAKAFPAYKNDVQMASDAFMAAWALLHGLVIMDQNHYVQGTRLQTEQLLQTSLAALLESFFTRNERKTHV